MSMKDISIKLGLSYNLTRNVIRYNNFHIQIEQDKIDRGFIGISDKLMYKLRYWRVKTPKDIEDPRILSYIEKYGLRNFNDGLLIELNKFCLENDVDCSLFNEIFIKSKSLTKYRIEEIREKLNDLLL